MREARQRPIRILKLPAGVWGKIVPAFALAGLAISVVPQRPQASPPIGTVPPLRTMVLIGVVVSILTATALYWIVTRDLGFARRVAIIAVAYNVLVIAVKFVLAPRGLYEVNRSRDLTSFAPISSGWGAWITAATVLALYLITYVAIYTIVRSRLAAGLLPRRPRSRAPRRLLIAVAVVLALLLVVPGAVIFLVLLGSGVEYLTFVFSSAVSLVIALILAVAASLASAALGSAADRARVVGDAAVLVSFFWLGLWFLALYHVLWVVYILVITSIWPLKVVVPK